MKSRIAAICIAILSGIAFIPLAGAAVTTNTWTGASGKWELGSNWSAGLPSIANALDTITQVIPVGSRLITADAATASSNFVNNCLIISNLTIGGTSLSPNTLLLANTGNGLPLQLTIENTLTLTSHGIISVTNATLYAGGTGISPNTSGIFNDGVIVVNNGTVSTPNNINAPLIVGWAGPGQMMVQNNGYVQSYWLELGYNPGSEGTLTMSGGTISLGGNGLGINFGALWLNGGRLNASVDVNNGHATISNGTWTGSAFVGPETITGDGTLTIAGGTAAIALESVGLGTNQAGTIWITGGQVISTNGTDLASSGPAHLTMSNGTWLAGSVDVANTTFLDPVGTGTVVIAGGAATFSDLHLAVGANTFASFQLTGGSLTVTNDATFIGELGVASFTVTGGSWLAEQVCLGASSNGFGTLTVSGGQVIVTNGAGRIAVGLAGADAVYQPRGSGQGRMSVGGGSLLTDFLDIGADESPRADLTIGSLASVTVLSQMTVGDCLNDALGTVEMTGGKLYVTNAAHNATLEVRNGFFLLAGGTLVVDRLVVTNTCYGIFDHIGGTLNVGTVVLDPNGDADGDGLPNWWEQAHGLDPLSSLGDDGADGDPDGDGYSNSQEFQAGSDPQNPLSTPLQIVPPPFQITSIVRSNNNIVLTWTTTGGTTNQVQVTNGGSSGIYSTNGFANLGAQILIGGSGVTTTNYTDVGGATNLPARYYRVRLVP